jgi:polyhydroxyalkanoate synthesis regulator phasin
MIGKNDYLNAYIDRRMKYIIEEWELGTRHDMVDYTNRLAAIEQELPNLRAFEKDASDKLMLLEQRARKLKERV